MLVTEFFAWWYSQGWSQVTRDVRRRLRLIAELFSAPSLIRTLFAPWRRIITHPDASIEARLRAMGDNLVSRGVGFVVRFFTLIAAACTLTVVGALSLALVLVWPLLPFGVIAALIMGIIG